MAHEASQEGFTLGVPDDKIITIGCRKIQQHRITAQYREKKLEIQSTMYLRNLTLIHSSYLRTWIC